VRLVNTAKQHPTPVEKIIEIAARENQIVASKDSDFFR